ncbi:MAG: PAS domain-containing protein [Hyphomicrobiaceae bacterium]
MKHRTNHVLYSYWNDVRGDRIAPRRFDIEPSQIASVLAETFILEFSEKTHTFEFRLAGTRICEQFGREFRGLDLFELFDTESVLALRRFLPETLKQGGVVTVELAAAGASRAKPVAFEFLFLPLLHTDATITRVLGSVAPANPPEWLGGEPLGKAHIKAHHIVWPDGRPQSGRDRYREPAPLLSNLTGARVVRFNRRSFRVVEGGRDRAPPKDHS